MRTKPLFAQGQSCSRCMFDYSNLTDHAPTLLQARSDFCPDTAEINDLRQLIRYHQDRECRQIYQRAAMSKKGKRSKGSNTSSREEMLAVATGSQGAGELRSNGLIDGLGWTHGGNGDLRRSRSNVTAERLDFIALSLEDKARREREGRSQSDTDQEDDGSRSADEGEGSVEEQEQEKPKLFMLLEEEFAEGLRRDTVRRGFSPQTQWWPIPGGIGQQAKVPGEP